MTIWVSKLATPALPVQCYRGHRGVQARKPALLASKFFLSKRNSSTLISRPPLGSSLIVRKTSSSAVRNNQNVGLLQTLSSSQKEQISLFVQTLLEWNQRMNLTAVREESEVFSRHVEDSLAILSPLCSAYMSTPGASSCDGLSVVDVGTGAGLPGLVFAVARPDWKITLLESMQKRCAFLEHVAKVVDLSNVQIVCTRAESAGQNPGFREQFDVAVARAVAEMRVLAEYCLPLVRIGGLFVAAKGHNPQEEAKSAEDVVKMMGGSITDICPVESLSPFGQRTAVICFKDHATPKKFPRQPGIPSKLPL